MDCRPLFIERRSRLAWWAFTLLLGGILAYIIITYLGAFVLGVFIYYATRPIYEQFADRMPYPNVGVTIALLTISLPVLVLIGYTLAVALSQFIGVAPDIGPYRDLVSPYLNLPPVQSPQDVISLVTSDPQQLREIVSVGTIEQLLGSIGAYLGMIASGLFKAFIALAVAFYLLRDDHKLAGWVQSALSRDNDTLVAYGQAVDQDLKIVFFGNILNAFVVAVTALFAYNALNLIAPPGGAIPSPTLLGLLTGAASLIPVIGMKIVYVPVAVYLGVVAGTTELRLVWFPAVFLLVSVLLLDGLTELILRPYISGRNLHVGLVLFAYILGPLMFGWYGLFFGPLILVLIVHLARIVLPELIHGEPLTPSAVGRDPIPNPDPAGSGPDATPSEESGSEEPVTDSDQSSEPDNSDHEKR
ncbi:AI-2E family transporter [Halocatena pleomorpha]|uniref:AI-2E family transporter n=1 Tax=Halocatena pleomorpha TaxID=1785090 RepID=A0A3P3RHP7_9EURY|nr:AI-2E family transporter [Halocatena pleomorpha]RRJ32468.1 AI-2E family transporter [Halocatena pleomorpha]